MESPPYMIPLIMIIASGSAPFFAKHLPVPALLLLVYTIAVGFAISRIMPARQPRIDRFLSSKWSLIVLLGFYTLSVLLIYPKTRTLQNPTTAPEAMIVSARHLLHGSYLYLDRLSDGAPISPGPGWILLNVSLSGTGLQSLLTPLYLTIAALFVGRAAGRVRGAVVFVLISFACLNFLQQSMAGHDIFAIGFAMLILTLLTFEKRSDERWINGLAAAAGVVATARVPLIVFPFILGLFLSRRSFSRALRFTLIALLVAVLFHGATYLWCYRVVGEYQPFHVFDRAMHGTGRPLLALGLLLSLAFTCLALRMVREKVSSWLIWSWGSLFIPFCMVGIGELIRYEKGTLANWEGKNYMTFTLPLLVGAFVLAAEEREYPE